MLDPRASRRAFTGPGFEDGQVRADLDRIEWEQARSARQRAMAERRFEASWRGAVPNAIRFDRDLPTRATLAEQVRQYVEWSSDADGRSIPLTTWTDFPCAGPFATNHALIFGLDSRTRDNPDPWHKAVVAVSVDSAQLLGRGWWGTAFWIHDPYFFGSEAPPIPDFERPDLTPLGPGHTQEEYDAHQAAITQWTNDMANYAVRYDAWIDRFYAAPPEPGSPVILLTAAHNLYESDPEVMVDRSQVAICRDRDDGSCRDWVSPGWVRPDVVAVSQAYYLGDRTAGSDWGIMGFADPEDRLKTRMGWKPFRLATATNETIRSATRESGLMKTGFPGFVRGCETTIHKYTERDIRIQSIGRSALHFYADASSGESGSPVYSCSGSVDPLIEMGSINCAEDSRQNTAYAVALVSVLQTVQSRTPIPNPNNTHPQFSLWNQRDRAVSGPKIPFNYWGILAEASYAVELIRGRGP